jgi:hypothetical protein
MKAIKRDSGGRVMQGVKEAWPGSNRASAMKKLYSSWAITPESWLCGVARGGLQCRLALIEFPNMVLPSTNTQLMRLYHANDPTGQGPKASIRYHVTE